MGIPVGEWIQQHRGARTPTPRFTQKDLAQACETEVGNVSRWERGIVVPKAKAFRCLCDLFGLDVGEEMKLVDFVAPNAPPSAKKDRRVAGPDEQGGAESHESGEHALDLPAAEAVADAAGLVP